MSTHHQTLSCWTCRLRRKKCDRTHPTCTACSALSITCHYSTTRPDWMDGGERQADMARRIRAQVKQGAEARRDRQYVRVLTLDQSAEGSDTSPPAASSSSAPAQSSTSPSSTAPSPGAAPPAAAAVVQHTEGMNEFLRLMASFNPTWSFSGPEGEVETHFTITYLDHVFPALFPAYRPRIQDGGRRWVLSTLRSSEALFHSSMSLAAFFYVVSMMDDARPWGRDYCNEACEQKTWRRLEEYMEGSVKAMQRDVETLNASVKKGGESLVPDATRKARVFEGIMQLLMFEVVLSKSYSWEVHLTAAITMLAEILEKHGTRDGAVDMEMIMASLYRPSMFTRVAHYRVWNDDQSAFRFYVAILLQADIVASTLLRAPPRLAHLHKHLLAADDEAEVPLQLKKFVGCHDWILVLIGEMATLDAWKAEAKAAGTLYQQELEARGFPLAERLQTGITELEIASMVNGGHAMSLKTEPYYSPDAATVPSEDRDVSSAISLTWAYAAELYLSTIMHGWKPNDFRTQQTVNRLIRLMTDLPSAAYLRTLAWPFCVAGCLATADKEQEFLNLAISMGPLRTYGTITDAVRTMEQIWHTRDQIDPETWGMVDCFNILGSKSLLL